MFYGYPSLGAADPQEDTMERKKLLIADDSEMNRAIEDHRASNKQAPRTIYGMIVAEADRIIDPEVTLRRTVQYGHIALLFICEKENQTRNRRYRLPDSGCKSGTTDSQMAMHDQYIIQHSI